MGQHLPGALASVYSERPSPRFGRRKVCRTSIETSLGGSAIPKRPHTVEYVSPFTRPTLQAQSLTKITPVARTQEILKTHYGVQTDKAKETSVLLFIMPQAARLWPSGGRHLFPIHPGGFNKRNLMPRSSPSTQPSKRYSISILKSETSNHPFLCATKIKSNKFRINLIQTILLPPLEAN